MPTPTLFAWLALCLISVASACSGSEDGVAENGGGGNASASDASSGGTGNTAGVGASGGSGNAGGALDSGSINPDAAFKPIPVRSLPGLDSITFYKRTGGTAPTPYEFTVNGPGLTVRVPDPLTDQSYDIPGATSKFYDVY